MNVVVPYNELRYGRFVQYACSCLGSSCFCFFCLLRSISRACLKLVILVGTVLVDGLSNDGMFELYSSPVCVCLGVNIGVVMRLG